MTTDIGIEGRIKHVQDVRAKHVGIMGGLVEAPWKPAFCWTPELVSGRYYLRSLIVYLLLALAKPVQVTI
ncbi:MAG: hypothetical protein J0G35_07090 [Acidobacteriales bacterium]|nr:hypothetical protein [Terriglobales bacterium]